MCKIEYYIIVAVVVVVVAAAAAAVVAVVVVVVVVDTPFYPQAGAMGLLMLMIRETRQCGVIIDSSSLMFHVCFVVEGLNNKFYDTC